MTTFEPHRVLRRHPAPRLYPDASNRIVLESPQPIANSLEWRLGGRYWQKHGVAPFHDGSVPYVINNSGWAPRAAAELIIAAAKTISGPLLIIEVAAGSGVFARQALDHLQTASPETYARLVWVCTDNSPISVETWTAREQFLPHQEHVHLTTANAEQLAALKPPDGQVIGVIANYALDSLPAEVVRADGQQLHLQACVYAEQTDIEQKVGMPLPQIKEQIASQKPEDLDAILPLLDWLEVQAQFLPTTVPHTEQALKAAQSDLAMVNVGALNFLQGALHHLVAGGFVLINDYGPTIPDDFAQQTYIHRFGGTVTCALNFPHLDHWLEERGCHILKPSGDEHRTIHTRVAVVGESPAIAQAFNQWYNDSRYVQADRLGAWTNSYINGGQLSEALDMFEHHLAWCPTDWHKLTEAAQLLMQQLGQLPEALELATAALQLNPWSSTLAWNVYGSVLYSMGAYDDAEQAWTNATHVYPRDPSTWLNFSYLYAARGDMEQALQAIARGLAYDRNGALRSALIQKQSEILGVQFQFQTARADRLTRRHRALTDAFRPPNN